MMTKKKTVTALLGPMLATLTLLAAACSGSSGTSVTAGAVPHTYQALLAYAQCMRTHGEPTFPDPVTAEGIPEFPSKPAAGPALQAAQSACQKLRPPGGLAGISQAQITKAIAMMLEISVCMRAHGITEFPDPLHTARELAWNIPDTVDQTSPQYLAAGRICAKGAAL
jgi:hypothetical protein